MRAAASAPGKVILFGEHFVVHGAPALVASIDLRAAAIVERAESGGVRLSDGSKDNPAVKAVEHVLRRLGASASLIIEIESRIPQSVGLGSSAALAASSSAAALHLLAGRLDLNLILESSHEGEKIIHYMPSGIDTSIATFGGIGVYARSSGYKKLDIALEEILVVNTGMRRRTGDMVLRVRGFAEREPERFKQLLDEAGRIIEEGLDALRSRDLERLGMLMSRNQELLRVVGVSSPELEEAIAMCLDAGAYGAKLTGAGGGGCVIAAADPDKMDEIISRISGRFEVFRVRLGVEGVRVERP
ncbi:MAG: mevalonate kinase [Nitrososphaerota archaeon]